MEAQKKSLNDPRAAAYVSRGELVELLRLVGGRIVIRDANGKRSGKFCLLCRESRRLRVPCLHEKIWALG